MKKIFLILAIYCLSMQLNAQQTFMQGWYWDYPKTANGFSWADTLRLKAPELKTAGFTHIWFPPHAVASFGTNSNGYDPKDLFIGNQTTGLGTRAALDNMLSTFTAQGIAPVADLIYNHRDGGAPEINPSVKNYITSHMSSSKEPFPSDRFMCVLPLGGTSLNGAGDYYFKISSKTNDVRFNGKGYKIYMNTGVVGFQNLSAQNEVEPNGGGDCTQGNNNIQLGRDMLATLETGVTCGTDEFKLTIAAGQFNPLGDSVFIFLNNTNNGYSDHRIYGLYSSARSADIVGDILYRTFTNFNNMPSGRGQMNYEFFKPNSTNETSTQLNGDWDSFLFFYDYDQFQQRTQDSLISYTKWNWDELGVRGIRMDAIKHFSPVFVANMLESMYADGKIPSMVVGEWYSTNSTELAGWVNSVLANMSAGAQAAIKPKIFDFALREQLRLACDDNGFDVRNVFSGSLRDAQNLSGFNIVTFANNHDFRDANGFASLLKNNHDLAYAYLFTNNQLGVPTVFYPDYYGYPAPSGGLYSYHPTNLPPLKTKIDSLMLINRLYINGSPTIDYLNKNGTTYPGTFIEGSSNKALIYQLAGTPANGGRDIIVAINFGTTRLKVDQKINNRGGAIAQGTRFYDVLGTSAFPYQEVNSQQQVYIDLPPKSYTVWAQNSLILSSTILSFNAQPVNDKVNLQWKVESEINVENYLVERSENGINFTTLGSVSGVNNGNSTYLFTDATLPKATLLYYRLKIVDKDGTFKYSSIVKVTFGKLDFNATVFPNPVEGKNVMLSLEVNKAGKLVVTIVNALGQKVSTQQINTQVGITNFTINVANFAAGNYTLIAEDGSKKITRQFIKK